MDTLQCAVVLAKLEIFKETLHRRRAVGLRYGRLLAATEIGLPVVRPDRSTVFGQYTVRIPHRDEVHSSMTEEGICTAVHYRVPLHKQPAYEQFSRSSLFPRSDEAAREVLSLPFHAYMSAEDCEMVVDRLSTALVSARTACRRL
jgi:UDP-2-acetamido-2-deoxy-ribo-hexuluronate aminotransferase